MTLTAVLLVGGESRRMGRDKATIEFEGRPLWERQLGILRSLKPEKIFVSARTKPWWLPDDVEQLLDDPPSRGPLSGLAKATVAMKTTHLVALAVDMPFMTGEQMQRLCSAGRAACGVVPVICKQAEPLAAVYPAEAADDFIAALSGSDFSLQSLVRTLAIAGKIELVPMLEKDEQLFRSVNCPSDIKEERFTNRPPN
jgi:molybdopterin-guanine dinucleotide biosynthesis protein A